MLEGLDISHHNGPIDWPAVARSGRRFAYCKVSDGAGYVDPTGLRNLSGARDAGLYAGGYHFARPTRSSARDEAAHALAAGMPFADGWLPPCLDLEGDVGPDPRRWASEWCAEILTRTGREPVLYASQGLINSAHLNTIIGARLWVARWGGAPPTTPVWDFWQYADNGTVPGIGGRVGLDRFAGDERDLAALARAGEAFYVRLVRKIGSSNGAVYADINDVLVHVTAEQYAAWGSPAVIDLPADDPIWTRHKVIWFDPA